MSWVWAITGIGLILVVLADVFFTVLHFDSYGFLTSNLYRLIWGVLRRATRPLPRDVRGVALSLGVPAMIASTAALWLTLLVLGFALVYYSQMGYENFAFEAGAEPGFLEALTVSGMSASTAGYSNITPKGVLEVAAFTEGVLAIGILTLTITYVLGIFDLLRELSMFAAGLHHQAEDRDDPWALLAPHFHEGQPQALSEHLLMLHRGLVSQYEGVRHYPIVYFFHSRRPFRSLPYVLHIVGAVAGAVRWGLPGHHPATKDPWLPTLLSGFREITAAIEEMFLEAPQASVPEPLSFPDFKQALMDDREVEDSSLRRFLNLNRFMADLASEDPLAAPEEAYERYKEWLYFSHRSDAFLKAVIEDLGYESVEIMPAAERDRVHA